MAHHELKILPSFFNAVADGSKRFEIRDNSDRGFQKGDTVELIEINGFIGVGTERVKSIKTGRSARVKITYVSDFNQPDNQVVFGFEMVQLFS